MLNAWTLPITGALLNMETLFVMIADTCDKETLLKNETRVTMEILVIEGRL